MDIILKNKILFILWFSFLLLIISCQANREIGAKIPSNIQNVSLSEVINNPSLYDGKEVLVKGIVSSQCASLCEFVLKDGVQSVTIYPQGFKLPRLEKGKEVKVYAKVVKGSEQVVFSAVGLSLQK